MAFDLDSVTFHLSAFEDEIVDLTKDMDPIRYSALMGTIGGFYHAKKSTFMDSKRAAWEVFQLIKNVAEGNFPPIEKDLTDGPDPVRDENRIPPESQLVSGVFTESVSPGNPPLHGGDESRPNPDHHG